VHEGVHVGGRQVVLLVPRRRRQDDVGEERRAGHPEVDRRQQVELGLGRLLGPLDAGRPLLRRCLGGGHRVVGAEQVLEEVLVALGAGAQQVGAPQAQDARVVLRGLRVLDANFSAPDFSCSTTYAAGSSPAAFASSARVRLLRLNVG
jgi:hypothetical protein